jgi:hypothetical protein
LIKREVLKWKFGEQDVWISAALKWLQVRNVAKFCSDGEVSLGYMKIEKVWII